jgi:hypothetical protein
MQQPVKDVEFELNENSSPSDPIRVSLLIVFDTSFLVDNVRFLQDLDLLAFPHQFIRIIIPWKVVKELENLSGSGGKSKSISLCQRARECSHILMQLINAHQSVVIGQRLDETFLNLNQSLHSSDDLILDCCEFFRKLYQEISTSTDPLQIAIMTNDKNLALKASIHHVKAILDWKKGAQEFLQDICNSDLMLLDDSDEVKSGENSPLPSANSPLQVLSVDPAVEFDLYSQHLPRFCDEIVQSLIPLLEEMLESLLGNHWSCALPAKPWKLMNVLQISSDNWDFLFRETLPLELKGDIKRMINFLSQHYPKQLEVKKTRLPSIKELETFQYDALKLVRLFGGKRLSSSSCKSPKKNEI